MKKYSILKWIQIHNCFITLNFHSIIDTIAVSLDPQLLQQFYDVSKIHHIWCMEYGQNKYFEFMYLWYCDQSSQIFNGEKKATALCEENTPDGWRKRGTATGSSTALG